MVRWFLQKSHLRLMLIVLLLINLIFILKHPDSLGLSLTTYSKINEDKSEIHVHEVSDLVEFNQTPCDLKGHLTKNLSTDPHAEPTGQGYIIYTCRGLCGGLADRLQGIATAYSIAKHTGRLFRIEENSRCSVTRFLGPSPWYNWTLDREPIRNLTACLLSAIWTSRIDIEFVQYINESVIYLHTNKRTIHLTQNFREIFYTLFVYDSSVVNEIHSFRSFYVKNNKTVCAHLRVGKSANFTDSHYNNLGNLSAVWQFLSSYDKEGYVIFIASDSSEVLSSARIRFKRFIEIPGHIIHIDATKDDMSCSGLRKTILDFAFLSQCDILLLTPSNMGKRASELRYNTKDQYCFQSGKVYPCPFYNLKMARSLENKNPLTGV